MKKYLLFTVFYLFTFISVNGVAMIQSSDCSIFSVPIGGVLIWPSLQIPEDYLPCDGRSYSIAEYEKLFKVIGYAYTPKNQQGAGHFNVPDLRGVFVRGWDNGRDYDPNRVLGTYQEDEFKSHTHQIPANANNNWWSGIRQSGNGAINKYSSDPAGGDETRPKNVAMQYLIRYRTVLGDV